MNLYRTYKRKAKCLGSNAMTYEQFVIMAEDELFQPYINSLKGTK